MWGDGTKKKKGETWAFKIKYVVKNDTFHSTYLLSSILKPCSNEGNSREEIRMVIFYVHQRSKKS